MEKANRKQRQAGITKLIVLFLTSVLLINCNNDDDGATTSGDLIGTWNLEEITYDGKISTRFEGLNINTNMTGEGEKIDFITVISEPDQITSTGSFDLSFTTSGFGLNETQTVSYKDLSSAGTWERDGNTFLTNEELIEFPEDIDLSGIDLEELSDTKYNIDELTDTTLRLSSTISQDFNQMGANGTIDIKVKLKYTRE